MPTIKFTISIDADKLMTELGIDVTSEHCFELLRDSLMEAGLKTFTISLDSASDHASETIAGLGPTRE